MDFFVYFSAKTDPETKTEVLGREKTETEFKNSTTAQHKYRHMKWGPGGVTHRPCPNMWTYQAEPHSYCSLVFLVRWNIGTMLV